MLAEPPGRWQPTSVDPGTTVFHYTAPAGLLGILEDRTLWATEVNGLNDTSEVVAGRESITAYAARKLEKDPGDPVMLMLSRAADQRFRTPMTTRVYVISASLDPDDAAQWRLYDGTRAGYALHIDTGLPLEVVAEASGYPLSERSAPDPRGSASVTR